jgi:hypothetical protein
VEVVDLGNLIPQGVEEAFLPGDLGGDGANLGLVEALLGPEAFAWLHRAVFVDHDREQETSTGFLLVFGHVTDDVPENLVVRFHSEGGHFGGYVGAGDHLPVPRDGHHNLAWLLFETVPLLWCEAIFIVVRCHTERATASG